VKVPLIEIPYQNAEKMLFKQEKLTFLHGRELFVEIDLKEEQSDMFSCDKNIGSEMTAGSRVKFNLRSVQQRNKSVKKNLHF